MTGEVMKRDFLMLLLNNPAKLRPGSADERYQWRGTEGRSDGAPD
jgi:hypothetical protein